MSSENHPDDSIVGRGSQGRKLKAKLGRVVVLPGNVMDGVTKDSEGNWLQ